MATTPTFTIKRHDVLPILQVKFLDDTAGTPVNLAAASVVKFIMSVGKNVVINTPCVPDADQTANPGVVRYSWVTGDTAIAGRYKGEFEVTWANGKVQTFPTGNYVTIVILADLG